MSMTQRLGLMVAGFTMTLSAIPAATAADFAFMEGQDFDATEYECLVAAIFDGAAEIEAAELERTAWVLKNRSNSEEFPGTYCEMAAEVEEPGPWTASAGNELVGEVMRLETGSDPYKRAVEELEAYRKLVNDYRQAQTAAYMLMRGWYEEDPTGGATSLSSELDEAEPT